ncbi:MAG: sigma factor-like helix-turn-helix DNA-binding protein [Chloroflexota bacterium]
MSLRTDWQEQKEILENSEAESDLPPEYCHYRDEGCEYAASCLNCPFLKCIFEEPGGRQRYLKRERDREIVRLYLEEGRAVRELALIFGISERTVQRAVKQGVKDRC